MISPLGVECVDFLSLTGIDRSLKGVRSAKSPSESQKATASIVWCITRYADGWIFHTTGSPEFCRWSSWDERTGSLNCSVTRSISVSLCCRLRKEGACSIRSHDTGDIVVHFLPSTRIATFSARSTRCRPFWQPQHIVEEEGALATPTAATVHWIIKSIDTSFQQ